MIDKIRSNPDIQKIISVIAHLSGEKILKVFLGLYVQIHVARYLGPSLLGQINYILEFTLLFTFIVSFGLDEFHSKEFAIVSEDLSHKISDAIGVRLILALIASGILILSAWIIKGEDPVIFFLICVSSLIVFSRAFEILEIFFQAQLKVRPVIISRQTGYLTTTAFKLLGVFFSWNWITFVLINIWEFLCIRLMLFREFRKSFKAIQISFSKKIFFSTLSFGVPYFIVSIFFFLEFKMLGLYFSDKYLSVKEVGYLSVVLNLVAIADFFIQIVLVSTLPSIVNVKSNLDAYRRRFVFLSLTVLVLLTLLYLVSIPLSKVLIEILFGQEFHPAASLLPWGFLFLIIHTWKTIKYRWFVMENQILSWLFIHFFSFLISVILMESTIRARGLKMVFISVIMGYLISALISFFSKEHKRFYRFIFSKNP